VQNAAAANNMPKKWREYFKVKVFSTNLARQPGQSLAGVDPPPRGATDGQAVKWFLNKPLLMHQRCAP